MHPLDGARERLKRADEDIRDLERAIAEFLAPVPVVTWTVEGSEPIVTDENRKAFEELRKFIDGPVNLKFRVLAGEIIHHLRSCFDHLAWELSSPGFRANPDSAREIQFPIYDKHPKPCGITRKQMCGYCRKVEGIASASALARIDSLQPYWASNPTRHPLWLIHNMDIIDKHRELKMANYIANLNINGEVRVTGVGRQMPWELRPRNVLILDVPQVDMKAKMFAQVTFSEFSGPGDESIIPTLQTLLRFTSDKIESFAIEFP
ncbi:MAG TPA: hypothetical protein VFO39_02185 [Candidatus Sulfotelmatobacter sp.]|nr:hypothetical protein [Candidatus Sulfotelmatobacter sp.]